MATTLMLPEADCIRPPAVLSAVRAQLQAGGCVIMATRDHADALPDSHEFTPCPSDCWEGLLNSYADLLVADNLRFRDRQGQVFERWSDSGWRREPRQRLEELLDARATRPGALLLVCEDAEISPAWRHWFEVQEIAVQAHSGMRRRRWSLKDAEGQVLEFLGGGMYARLKSACAGYFEAAVAAPQQEMLLAVVAEYAALRYDCRNLDERRLPNVRDDRLHEMVAAVAGRGDAADLLEDLEAIHDLVATYVDFTKLGFRYRNRYRNLRRLQR